VPTILHLADLHLGWTPAFMDPVRATERRRRRDDLLRRAVDFALETHVDMVVIAGDLFETHEPDGELVGTVLAQLRSLDAGRIPAVTVPGNHDEITYFTSVYRAHADRWPGILVRSPDPVRVASVDVGGQRVHVYSLAYTGGVTGIPLAGFPCGDEPGIHVAVLHGTLGDWGGDRSLPLDPAQLRSARYDYAALGHIHKHERHGSAVYAGMVEGKGFDDPGMGALTVADVQPGRVDVRLAPIVVQPVSVVELDVSGAEDASEIEAAVGRHASPESMLRVRLRGARRFALDAESLRAAQGERFFHLEVRDETRACSDEMLERWSGEATVLGEFVRRMRGRLEAASDPRERRLLAHALGRGVEALTGGRR